MNLKIIKNTVTSSVIFLLLACTNTTSPDRSIETIALSAKDTVAAPAASQYQLGNVINNPQALAVLQRSVRRADSAQTVINVLHIGDSHIKSGYYSQPFMLKLNDYYSRRYHGRLFFNFQWFCKIGTKYSDYNELAELDDQLIKSQPHLVIISLGTNDAFSGSSRVNFYQKIDHLVKKIRSLAPQSSILITTPPDALKRDPRTGSYTALPELINVVNTIMKYCVDNKIAFWNLYQIMGGSYSIGRYANEKLAAPDHVHFTAKGYGMFAQWLFEAFTKTIN